MIDLMPDDYKRVYLINQQKWITEDEYEKEKPDSYNFYEKGEYVDESLIVFMMPTIRDGTKKYNNAVFISEFVNVKNEIIILNMILIGYIKEEPDFFGVYENESARMIEDNEICKKYQQGDRYWAGDVYTSSEMKENIIIIDDYEWYKHDIEQF